MNPEIRQQLYGGEISDYYPIKSKNVSPEKDYKNMGDLYQQILNKNNPPNPPNPPNLPSQIKNKITIIK